MIFYSLIPNLEIVSSHLKSKRNYDIAKIVIQKEIMIRTYPNKYISFFLNIEWISKRSLTEIPVLFPLFYPRLLFTHVSSISSRQAVCFNDCINWQWCTFMRLYVRPQLPHMFHLILINTFMNINKGIIVITVLLNYIFALVFTKNM